MRTYEDNVEAINELWQSFAPTHELRQLFRERLAKLDQAALYEAIKQAKVDNEGPWPAIKWFITAYAEVQRKRREAMPKPRETYTRSVIPAVDTEAEKQLVKEFQMAIEGCTDEGFRQLDEMILDKMEKENRLSAYSTHCLCRQLREHLFGVGPGLSRVTPEGGLERMPVSIPF